MATTVFRAECPDCDICGQPQKVVWDLPTVFGPWAYACSQCIQNGISAVAPTADYVTMIVDASAVHIVDEV